MGYVWHRYLPFEEAVLSINVLWFGAAFLVFGIMPDWAMDWLVWLTWRCHIVGPWYVLVPFMAVTALCYLTRLAMACACWYRVAWLPHSAAA